MVCKCLFERMNDRELSDNNRKNDSRFTAGERYRSAGDSRLRKRDPLLPFSCLGLLPVRILGVLIEGVFCIFFYGHWETHVTTFFGWYNALYSVGAVLYFFMAARMDHAALWKKVLAMTLVSTLLELLAGLLILRGLGMRAWDYNDTRFNFMGLIAPLYSLGWAIPALFVSLTYRKAGTSAAKLKSSFWKKAAVVLCILISADLLLAAVCMSRWSIRHYSGVSERPLLIERIASDDWMASRFVEWRFIE